jgi:hypothetical protein
VANTDGDTVGKYNITTGGALNASFITGLNGPIGLALKGNILYVASTNNRGIYSAAVPIMGGAGTVGEYNATTGEPLNVSLITGLDFPFGLAIKGNTLFVVNRGAGTVGEYNATTGQALNANFITGLNAPTGILVNGNTLFVANPAPDLADGIVADLLPLTFGKVGEYNATTGEAVDAEFITGAPPFDPIGLALLGNTLLVVDQSNGTVGQYNATTGEALNANFITGLTTPSFIVVKGAK